ncbi:MAG: transposase [Caldiserica bacterium]|jgi:putative transposase|nr:transposase [Caldisericota bacterium]MDH7562086.1 transposase [Caldisericota bacterium]
MARKARNPIGGAIYHVLNRGNGKQTVFFQEKDYLLFLRLLRETKKRFSWSIYSYCLMPNHFHLVLSSPEGKDLSRGMHWLCTSHVRLYHKEHETTGHLWQDRFRSFLVQEDEHFLMVMRYVEANPIRAGLVSLPGEWKWSSFRERIGEKVKIPLLDESPVPLPSDWSAYVREEVGPGELENLRECANRQAPFGKKGWMEEIFKKLGQDQPLKPRGRPRKNGDCPHFLV